VPSSIPTALALDILEYGRLAVVLGGQHTAGQARSEAVGATRREAVRRVLRTGACPVPPPHSPPRHGLMKARGVWVWGVYIGILI
jgi:hypothetical protein